MSSFSRLFSGLKVGNMERVIPFAEINPGLLLDLEVVIVELYGCYYPTACLSYQESIVILHSKVFS